jgi:predicted MFS family arabinose efflux permease
VSNQSSKLASALNQSAFNLRDALGAVLGAALHANGFGYLSLPLIGAAVVCLAQWPPVLSRGASG